jgi:hypothetical protein
VHFLIESYVAHTADAVDDIEHGLARIVESDVSIQHVASTYAPGDELAVHVFQARSIEHLRDSATSAGIATERVTPVIRCEPKVATPWTT